MFSIGWHDSKLDMSVYPQGVYDLVMGAEQCNCAIATMKGVQHETGPLEILEICLLLLGEFNEYFTRDIISASG